MDRLQRLAERRAHAPVTPARRWKIETRLVEDAQNGLNAASGSRWISGYSNIAQPEGKRVVRKE
jgi:hypothetical protein